MNERLSFGELPSKMIEAVLAVESYVNNCGFDTRLLELLRYRISQLNGCAYCLDRHYKEGIHAGETAMRLYSLPVWEETPFYTERERAALRWADAVTLLANNAIGDDLIDEKGFAVVNARGGLSIKVGAGETSARARLDSVDALHAQIARWLDVELPHA